MSGPQRISQAWYEAHCSGKAWPLPQLSPASGAATKEPNKYDVVIAGAGPAGIFLRLLLARYGVNADSVICLESKSRATDLGQADGFNARTVEVLATLGLEHDIVRYGREFTDHITYLRSPDGIQKVAQKPIFMAPSRFGQIYCHHQGRFETSLLQDLARYTQTPVHYSSTITEVVLDEADPDYPVLLKVRVGEETRGIRAKYVVGADGAHSAVRKSMGIQMIGDAADEIWGVIDFVPDSNLPDIRRHTHFRQDENRMLGMTIQREKMSDGNWLMRLYIGMDDDQGALEPTVGDEVRESVRRKKAEVTQERILERASSLFHPYYIRPKPGTQPIWWTTYGVGQRLAERFHVDDSQGHPRIFLVGDACHTHSPRQGQGLNISTQDAYYLSWRLAYVLLGLTKEPTQLLHNYTDERRAWARRVVFADKRWNEGKVPWPIVFEEMKAQVTGCGIEEAPSLVVSERNDAVAWRDKDLLQGTLRTGRRLFNVPVTRFADSLPIDIHEDFPSDGRWRALVLAATDFPRPHGRSRAAVEAVCALTRKRAGLVDAVFLQPHPEDDALGWADMPAALKTQAEMLLHCADEAAYATYGVSREHGALALVRPDGIVCITAALEDVDALDEFLGHVLVGNAQLSNGVNGF